MISLQTIFWIFVIFFALIGAIRGWSKEVVAAAGLVLSLFTLKQFGSYILALLGMVVDPTLTIDPDVVYRRQFWILTAFHLFIAFFSYQGPTLAASVNSRLRPRDTAQEKVLGAIFGAANGYLIIGTLISFLEFRVRGGEFVRLLANESYPFPATMIARPADAAALVVFNYLPLDLFQGTLLLPLILVALFLVVIIVII